MKKYNYTDVLSFANTAAGKFVSVVVAVVMVLSLSSIALAVDEAVEELAAATAQETSSATAAQAASTHEGNGAENESAANGAAATTGEAASTANESAADNSAASGTATAENADASTDFASETPQANDSETTAENASATPGEASGDASSNEGNGDAAAEGAGASEGATTSEGTQDATPIDTESAIQAATLMDTQDADETSNKVDEATVSFVVENCSIEYNGQPVQDLWQVPWHQELQFTVVPTQGYVVKHVSYALTKLEDGAPIPTSEGETLSPSSDGIYTVPANYVSSTLSVNAVAVADEENPPVDPETDPIKDDTELIPDGTFDAPVISVQDMVYTYCGLPLPITANDIPATAKGLQKLEGHEADTVVITGFAGSKQTNVGSSTLSNFTYEIYRGAELVTNQYKPATFANPSARVTVNKANLYIVTPSATKVFDGEALEYEGDMAKDEYDMSPIVNSAEGALYYFGPTKLYELMNYNGPSYTLHATGSQTQVGSSVNTYAIEPESVLNALKDNYNIIPCLGTLTVLPSEDVAYIVAPSASRTYNGKALKAKGITWGGLPEGFTVKAKVKNASRTNVGTTTTTIDPSSVQILNAEGTDVTSSYPIEIVPGEVKVLPAYLYVTTKSATKTADGRALTAGGSLTGLVKGEKATLKTTGKQTEVGSSKNTYRIEWKTAKKSNYRIVEDLGTLKVKAARTTAAASATTGGTTYTGPSYTAGANADDASSATATPRETATRNTEDTESSGINPAIEAVAQGMQNAEQIARGEEPTSLKAPAVEETLADNETPLGVFDEPIDCWVHWYAIIGIIVTAVYGGVVMFFRRAYAYELESREADVLGVPVGLAQPHAPVSQGSEAGRRA